MNQNREITQPQPPANTTGGQIMKMQYDFHPLQDTYLSNNEISENDTDVVFICSDGIIHAHKVVLALSSMFFIKLFENEVSSEITTILVPDISKGIMRLILLLNYKDNVRMNDKEFKAVTGYLNLFGMNLNQFRCNVVNPDYVVNLSIQEKTKPLPQPYPPQRQQEQTHQKRTQKYQQQIQVKNYEQGQGERQRGQLIQNKEPNKLQPQQNPIKQLQQLLPAGHVQNIQGNKKVVLGHQASGEKLCGFRPIAPKPLLHNDGGEIDLYDGASDQKEIQIETEDSNEEDNVTVDPECGRIMIQEWVQNVGRDNTSSLPKMSVSSGIKPTVAGSSRTSNQTQPGTSRSAASANQCLICNHRFEDDNKWYWHETHHVGKRSFKCGCCDKLFSTSRKVYEHEMMEHGVNPKDNSIEGPTIPEDFQIVNGRKRKFLDSEVESNIPVGFLGQQDKLTLGRTKHGTSSFQRRTRWACKVLMKSEDGEGGENKCLPVTCPVCGAPVEKFVEHLQMKHFDLDVLVSTVGNDLLSCQKCCITFPLWDLSAHKEYCGEMQQFKYVNERQAQQLGPKSRPTILKVKKITIPPCIGCSPIDVIECKDS